MPFYSYGRDFTGHAPVTHPIDEAGIRAAYAYAVQNGLTVVLRSAGNGLHSQSIGDDLCVSDERLHENLPKTQRIVIDGAAQTFHVKGPITWSELADEAAKQGLVPFGCVTSKWVAPGGSIAADGLSRFSPLFGKESEAYHWVRLVCPGHAQPLIVWNPTFGKPQVPAGCTALAAADNERVYRAVMGGCGLLGIVTEVKGFLLRVRSAAWSEPSVWTRYECLDLDALFLRLLQLQTTRPARLASLTTTNSVEGQRTLPKAWSNAWTTFFSAPFLNVLGGERGLMFLCGYDDGLKGSPLSIWDLKTSTNATMLLMRILPKITRLLETATWLIFKALSNNVWHNKLSDWTFFMSAHTQAMDAVIAAGKHRGMLQQTYLVPCDPQAADLQAEAERVSDFVRDAKAIFGRKSKGRPGVVSMCDALFMPASKTYLSGSYQQAGMAVTFGFEGVQQNPDTLGLRKRARDVAALCANVYGGRVHFGKNVWVRSAEIDAMWWPNKKTTGTDPWNLFLAAKDLVDPTRRIDSDLRRDELKRLPW